MPKGSLGTDKPSAYKEQKSPLKMYSLPTDSHSLEKIFCINRNFAIKINMNLNALKPGIEKEQENIPAKLSLTDSEVFLIDHISVNISVPVTYDSRLMAHHLNEQDAPSAFENYSQFMNWLKGTPLLQEVQVTYDFNLNIQEKAPGFAEYLTSGLLESYHFKGKHTMKHILQPDHYIPSISYLSQRGNTNATTAILGGTLYFEKRFYSTSNYQQIFPHQKIEETILDRGKKGKFYSCQWVARSKSLVKTTYREFPEDQINNWPNPPCEFYNIVHNQYGDLEDIHHINCWDGESGQTIDISDGAVFSITYEDINKQEDSSKYIESIVQDSLGKLYTVHYHRIQRLGSGEAHAPSGMGNRLSLSGEFEKEEEKIEKRKKKKFREIAHPKSQPHLPEKTLGKQNPVFFTPIPTEPNQPLRRYDASPVKKYQSKTPPPDFKAEERQILGVIFLKKETSPPNS